MSEIAEIFEKQIKGLLPEYRYRESQAALASRIETVIADRNVGVYEAGTGTGKTLSYLVPALLSDLPVIISTGTKNLQDQLFLNDIPALKSLFPQKRIALLKGRGNYLCPYRLSSHLQTLTQEVERQSELMEVRQWSSRTLTGDITELFDPAEKPWLVSMVTSTRDNCLGSRCPEFDDCPLYRARQQANDADVVIVNHHLLFADLIQREESLPALLPESGAVIIDEAHQIPDTAMQFFGERIGSGQLTELARDIAREQALLGNDDVLLLDANRHYLNAVESLRDKVMKTDEVAFDRCFDDSTRPQVDHLDEALLLLSNALSRVAERSEGLAQCWRRALRFTDMFALLTESSDWDEESVHWIDRGERHFVIFLSPLSIAKDLARMTEDSRAWLFVSATLSVAGSFEHFLRETGLNDVVVDVDVFESPFDYHRQVRGYISTTVSEPGADTHTHELIRDLRPLLDANSGRTFFLFTSHRALGVAADCLIDLGRPVLTQGNLPKNKLLEYFKTQERSVLLATQSFWEGVDVRGCGLTLLILDKLPFPSPVEPLFAAKATAIEQLGGNSFSDLSLPQAALHLKQGFGRLIRDEADQGLVVIGDPRLKTRTYGGYFLNVLPQMQWLDNRSAAIDWLREL